MHITVGSIDVGTSLAFASSPGVSDGEVISRPLLVDGTTSVFSVVLPDPMPVVSTTSLSPTSCSLPSLAPFYSLSSILLSSIPLQGGATTSLVHVLLLRSSATSAYRQSLAQHLMDLASSLADMIHLDRLRSTVFKPSEAASSALPLHVRRAAVLADNHGLLDLKF